MTQDVINADEAARTVRANMSPRQRELDLLERYAEGRQYEGLPDWFTDADIPLWERAPCITYNIAGAAIQSNVDLVLGEGLFPELTSNPGEDDEEAEGLDLEESKKVDRGLCELYRRTRFRAVMRQAFRHAQKSKSVAVIAGTRVGRPFLEVVRARWCEPTFDALGRVTKLEIRYPYVQPVRQPDGKWKLLPKLYRRVIDEKSDTTFQPVDADKSGVDPKPSAWVPNKDLTVDHNLGFCPVHWYAHMRECSTVADYDGEAVHQECCDEIRGLDFALSQKHRAALYTGEPQGIETGVERGYNPSGEVGREAILATTRGGSPSGDNPVEGGYRDLGGGKPARRKTPGGWWQYEQKDAKVAYLTLPPEALEAIASHSADLRNKLCEMLAYVPTDPENVKYAAAMSGKAIEALKSRQFARCKQYRDDVGDNLLIPVTHLLLRVALATKLAVPAVKAAAPALEKYIADDTAAPLLFVRWSRGFLSPGVDEEKTTVDAVVAARGGALITKRMALEKLKSVFPIDNVDQALEELEEEATENQARAVENAKAMNEAVPPKPGGPPVKPTDAPPAPAQE